jgi:hypothetical protein
LLVAELSYRIEAVMTDNDLIFTMRYAFHSQRQTRFQQACRSLGIEHWRARPRHPESNGRKAAWLLGSGLCGDATMLRDSLVVVSMP